MAVNVSGAKTHRPREKDMAPGSCRYFIRLVKMSFITLFILCLCMFVVFFAATKEKLHATIKLG